MFWDKLTLTQKLIWLKIRKDASKRAADQRRQDPGDRPGDLDQGSTPAPGDPGQPEPARTIMD